MSGMWDGKWQGKSFHLVRSFLLILMLSTWSLHKLKATKFDQQCKREFDTIALLWHKAMLKAHSLSSMMSAFGDVLTFFLPIESILNSISESK
mgnify:CR=1 FL=1